MRVRDFYNFGDFQQNANTFDFILKNEYIETLDQY